jgi:TrmH family RNA methyltransferase
MSGRITSRRHARVIELRRLAADAAARRAAGLCLVEGARVVRALLLADAPFVLAMVSPRLLRIEGGIELDALLRRRAPAGGAVVLDVTDSVMDAVADATSPQGVVVAARRLARDRLPSAGGGGHVLVAWEVQDPGNVGGLVRSAAALGAAAFLSARAPGGQAADPLSPRALRGSAGAAFRLPIHEWEGAPEALAEGLRQEGFRVAACVAHGGDAPAPPPRDAALALVVGSEAHGLPADLAAAADVRWTIPLAAGVESLGVVAAASVLLHGVHSGRTAGSTPTGGGR